MRILRNVVKTEGIINEINDSAKTDIISGQILQKKLTMH
jgi:hypothetical protein